MVVGEGLLEETFAHLRRCGEGRRECVVYWTGPLERPGCADGVLHPTHTASARHYEVDGAWLDQAWFDLARRRREIRVQVHTHGRSAYHSVVDDEYPVVGTPGLVSLVLPAFALGEIGLDGAHLTRLEADGDWQEYDPAKVLEVPR